MCESFAKVQSLPPASPFIKRLIVLPGHGSHISGEGIEEPLGVFIAYVVTFVFHARAQATLCQHTNVYHFVTQMICI
jgi:hypothetical protein